MSDLIRMNQRIPRAEEPEIFDYLSQFSERARAAQARKLMLLGLVEMNRLGSGVPAQEVMIPSSEPELPAANDDSDLVVQSGVNDLF